MKRINEILLILLLLLIPNLVSAQQDVQITHYMLNKMVYNPAYTGQNVNFTEFSIIQRSQWLGYNGTFDQGGAPNSQLFTFDMPLTKFKSGIGAMIINDNIGPISNFKAQFNYGYHQQIKEGVLSFGLATSYYSLKIQDSLRVIDPNDPLISTVKGKSSSTADFSGGIAYNTARYFIGFSTSHLNQPFLRYLGGLEANRLKRHYFFNAGYNIIVNQDVVISPSLIVKSDLSTLSYEVSSMLTYQDKVHFGINYRDNDAIGFIAGARFLKENAMKLSYAFDYVVAGRTAKRPTSHEILLAYRLPSIKWKSPLMIRTPRYRHD